MIVNILPTRTWNRLGMNESQIQIEWPEESVLIKPERLAAGVTWEKEISGRIPPRIAARLARVFFTVLNIKYANMARSTRPFQRLK